MSFFFKVTRPEPFGGAFWEILFRLLSLKQGETWNFAEVLRSQ